MKSYKLTLIADNDLSFNEDKVCDIRPILFVTIIAGYKQILNRRVQRVMW